MRLQISRQVRRLEITLDKDVKASFVQYGGNSQASAL